VNLNLGFEQSQIRERGEGRIFYKKFDYGFFPRGLMVISISVSMGMTQKLPPVFVQIKDT
jgi:hypothetical protein